MKKGASAPASPQPNEYPNSLTPNDTGNTTQANHGDPEDPNTYGLCRCCDVRPVANPFDDLCPVCMADEPGHDEFTHEVGF
jgi:hypothetical protein